MEDMNPDFLIGPVVSGPDGGAAAVLHAPEGVLNVVLCAVATDDSEIAPVAVVGSHEQGEADDAQRLAPPCCGREARGVPGR